MSELTCRDVHLIADALNDQSRRLAADSGAELHRQAELARNVQADTTREVISGLDMDVRILARELYGREGHDLEVAVRAIDRMTRTLATLRGHLAAGLAEPEADQ